MSTYFENSAPLWKPTNPSWTAVEQFRRLINDKHKLQLKDYHDLHKYSVQSLTFWLDLWEYLGIISSVPPGNSRITQPGPTPEVPIWFPDARLNYAENLLFRTDDAVAITAKSESGALYHYTYRDLRERVRQTAGAMRKAGLKVGDRVAGVVNNTINAVVICLATASIGGIFSSTATDMGTEGILDRYRQIKPKFVFAETEITYGGKVIDLVPKITEVFRDLREYGLEVAVTFPSLVSGKEIVVPQSITFSKFLKSDDGKPLVFEQLPFRQPLFILYSSGTSGPPKCIVHSAGGVLLQQKKESRLNLSINTGDTLFQFTTTGWMMWTYMLIGLSCGARIILYDGSPFYPNIESYLEFIHDQRITVLGTSPRFLAEVQGKGIRPLSIGSFESLRTVSVTGAVLTTPMFHWTQAAFGKQIHVISTSGGTDVCTAFVTGCSSLPVYAGEMQCKSLGMDVKVFDPAGNDIEQTGEPGELVCLNPHPSLPVQFWGDKDGKKFRDAYYSTYPGVWRQGDFMVVNPKTKGLMILGRSDGVLNPSGVRFGSGEIYNVLEQFTSVIEDSLCVGQRRTEDEDERVLLFLKMRSGKTFDSKLVADIKAAIRQALSPRHVPAFVFETADIPYTVNGKRIEIAVKQIVSGYNLKPSGTVANPESLQLYYQYRSLEPVTTKTRKAKL
ncbi:unnamed protein product [Mycena citricolor]|uniref:AMP-dependent synthetase/ligase domain-containing protein n=1 Tax=Mycena citricolor TaxID=2018698 RepID=A0AAD2GZR1_9AGAR|nr:unnamed protein product [Mycena citricolor]CAK5281292.1 unnamed protein product [Mycena citricolor]